MALQRFIFASDIHGDQQCPKTNAVLFDFLKVWKPKIRVCGGDLWDFRPLRKGASDDEKRESLTTDYEAGEEWFHKFKPTVLICGNHDNRIFETAENGVGIVGDWADKGVADIIKLTEKHGCRLLPYDKRLGIYMLGNTVLLHGFHSGINAVRQTALIYGNAMFGHVHAIDQATIPGLQRRVARSVGCCCKLDMKYAAKTPSTLRQSNGFVYGFLDDRTGETQTFQAESIGGKWMLPTEFTNL